MIFTQPFRPQFGTGAPGVSVLTSMPYYDVGTNPYTPYIYNAGAWHTYSDLGSSNATQIQGVDVSTTAPTNGQVLTYLSGTTKWTPQ